MGACVLGSITSPRIFISMSIVPLPVLILDGASYQAVGKTLRHFYQGVAAWCRKNRPTRYKIQCDVLRSTPVHLSALRIVSFNSYFHNLPDVLGVVSPLPFPLPVQQHLQPLPFLFVRNRVDHHQRRRVRPRRILEREDGVVLHRFQQAQRLLKLRDRLAREANNDVGRDADRPPRFLTHPMRSRYCSRVYSRCMRFSVELDPLCTGRCT